MKLGEIVEYLRTMKYNTSAPPFIKIRSLDEKQKKMAQKSLIIWIGSGYYCVQTYRCVIMRRVRIDIHSWIGK